ncbi:MAG: phytanoyl-CoA dioxygenase family protein, partial [Rhodanobacteraceae bacterium]
LGRLVANEAAAEAAGRGKYLCQANAGDALLFRPLLLHSSHKVISTRPRRVLHFEFSNAQLPVPLLWAEAAA